MLLPLRSSRRSVRGPSGPLQGVGVGWRPELAADLLVEPTLVSFVEVVAESCFANASRRREAEALTSLWPVIPHGVKLSLAGADAVDGDRVSRLVSLVRSLRAPLVTEHMAFVRAGGVEIGHLTAPPRTRAAVAALARNVGTLRRALPSHVPLLLENAATTVPWPKDEMSPGAFAAAVVKATGCDLLLDVANLCADAWNAGVDPLQALRDFPCEHVGMVHVAGGQWEELVGNGNGNGNGDGDGDGKGVGGRKDETPPFRFYVDTHAHPTPPQVFEVLSEVLARRGPVPLILERDDDFPPFDELASELGRLRKLAHAAGSGSRGTQPSGGGASPVLATGASAASLSVGEATFADEDGAALAEGQRRLAALLGASVTPAVEDVHPFSPSHVTLTRRLLLRKRVDEALPLLPHLGRKRAEMKSLPTDEACRQPRLLRFSAVEDAIRLAQLASASPRLRDDARRDLAILRALFSRSARGLKPRWAPYANRLDGGGSRSTWVMKGFGRRAHVKLWSRP